MDREGCDLSLNARGRSTQASLSLVNHHTGHISPGNHIARAQNTGGGAATWLTGTPSWQPESSPRQLTGNLATLCCVRQGRARRAARALQDRSQRLRILS
eukprot:272283-Rhodomonas_salina.1